MRRLLWVFAFLLSPAALAEVAIITNLSNTEITSKKDVESFFLGMKTFWDNGEKALVVIQPGDHIACQKFNDLLLQKNNVRFKSHWSRLIFAGRAEPPVELGNNEKVLEYIKRNPNAIGYVDLQSVDDDVRILFILK
jgi:ABC-type phosphate transport system substrate-binding protein